MSDFSTRVEAFLDEYFRLHPTFATTIGEHAHDDRWPDLSAAGRAERLAFGDRWLAEFAAMDGLTADEAIDRDLLVGELEAARFEEIDVREDAWNPLVWVYLLGDGLFTLNAREFAPLADRLASTAGRLETMPAVLDAARETLVGARRAPGRPLPDRDRAQAVRRRSRSSSPRRSLPVTPRRRRTTGSPRSCRACRPPPPRRAAALAAFETHLRDVVLPASDGEGRLGAALFAAKMRHTMRSETLTPERILAEAEREFTAVRAEMVRLARDLWPAWCPGRAAPDGRGGARSRGPRRGRRGPPGGGRPARVLPPGERPDRGVLPGA